jgi:hypothetical protein
MMRIYDFSAYFELQKVGSMTNTRIQTERHLSMFGEGGGYGR